MPVPPVTGGHDGAGDGNGGDAGDGNGEGGNGAKGEKIFLQDLADGYYSLRLKAVDGVGNTYVNESAFQWRVDLTPPTSALEGTPQRIYLTDRALFQVVCGSFYLGPGQVQQGDCAYFEYTVSTTTTSSCDSRTVVSQPLRLDNTGLLNLTQLQPVNYNVTFWAVDAAAAALAVPKSQAVWKGRPSA